MKPLPLRASSIAWIVAWALALGLLATRAAGVIEQSPQWEKLDTYSRVEFWVQSAACLVRTGIPLVVCDADGSAVRPIEDASPADDRGHVLLGNAVAFVTHEPITRATLIRINLAVNVVATLLLALSLWACGWRLSAVAVVVAGAMLAMLGPHPGPDSHSSYIGGYLLSLIAALWAAQLARVPRSLAWTAVGLVLAAGGLAMATLLRQPYGLGGLVAALATIGIVLLPHEMPRGARRSELLWLAAGCIVFVVAVRGTTPALVAWREKWFGVPRGTLVLEHGIAHNLYLGLGAEPNPWGLVWDDGRGAQDVHAREPGVSFVSDRYFDSVFSLWWECVRTEPVAAIRIYATKAWKSIWVFAGERGARLAGFTVALVLLGAVLWKRRRRVPWADAAWIFGAAVGVLGVLSQGVLGFPASAYIDPGRIGIWILVFAMVEALLRTWRAPDPAADSG